jgi:tetratricopeptide (TPR) repeat protein
MDVARRLNEELHTERGRRRAIGLAALAGLWTVTLAIAGAGVVALLAPAAVVAAVLAVVVVLGRPAAPERELDAARPRIDGDVRALAVRARAVTRRVAVTFGELARTAMQRGIDAWRAARSARAQARPTGASELDEARRLSEASATLREQGRLDEAVTSAEMAVRLFASMGDRRREALALNRLGLAHAKAGRSEEAIASLERAAAMLGELGEAETQGRVIANLGTLHEAVGRRDVAVAHWHDALAKLEPASPAHERLSRRLHAAV